MAAKMNRGYRENQYDVLRIISCIAVVLIHANWFYFSSKYNAPDGTSTWAVEALTNILTRFSIPCFAMISGAFNLRREVNALDFYKKTSFKIFLPTIIFIVLFTIYQILENIIFKRNLIYRLRGILSGGFFNFWFVYMLVILYLLTPAIILIKNRCTWTQYKVIAVMWAIWAVASQATSSQKLAWSIGVVMAYVPYYMLGDILSTELKKKKPKRLPILLIGFACVTVSYFWRKAGHNYYIANPYTNFFSPTVMVYSICVFIIFGSMDIKKNVSRISELTFYLYLFHTLVLGVLERIIGSHLPDIPGIVVLTIVTVVISYFLAIVFDSVWKKMISKRDLKTKWNGMRIWRLFEANTLNNMGKGDDSAGMI